jgi:hypothetical protein
MIAQLSKQSVENYRELKETANGEKTSENSRDLNSKVPIRCLL